MKKIYFILIGLVLTAALLLFSFSGKNSFNGQTLIPTPTSVPYPITSRQGSVPVISFSPKPGAITSQNQQIIITFDKNISPSNIVFKILPQIQYTSSIKDNTLIITPNQPLFPGVTYSYSIQSQQGGIPTTSSFTIEGPTPTPAGPNTAVGAKQERDAYLLQHNPSGFLADQTPYSNSQFSINSKFKSTGGYQFAVSLSGDRNVSQQSFLNWLQSLGLTDSQIQSLDIVYQ